MIEKCKNNSPIVRWKAARRGGKGSKPICYAFKGFLRAHNGSLIGTVAHAGRRPLTSTINGRVLTNLTEPNKALEREKKTLNALFEV